MKLKLTATVDCEINVNDKDFEGQSHVAVLAIHKEAILNEPSWWFGDNANWNITMEEIK